MLVFFTNLSYMEFHVRYLALFLPFSVIDCFGWFWIGSLHKNIQLMLEFLKAPFLVLHFSYYTLTHFFPMFPFSPQKTKGFLMFSGGSKGNIGKKWVNDFPDDVICNIAIYANETTFYSSVTRHLICGNN